MIHRWGIDKYKSDCAAPNTAVDHLQLGFLDAALVLVRDSRQRAQTEKGQAWSKTWHRPLLPERCRARGLLCRLAFPVPLLHLYGHATLLQLAVHLLEDEVVVSLANSFAAAHHCVHKMLTEGKVFPPWQELLLERPRLLLFLVNSVHRDQSLGMLVCFIHLVFTSPCAVR